MLGKRLDFDLHDEITGETRVKIANFNEIQHYTEGLIPDPRYMYLHVIAMGAGEYYGCNKNGDYFPERSLIAYHKTFETSAKIFKEHNNRPGSPDYGFVAKAWYNPDMHRVELVLAVDREKAPDIVAKVEKGEVPEVSMGCKIPKDYCSLCGNAAAKKSEYCDHIRYELKKILADGRQAFMLNLQPTFFDISFVFRRADKIALTLKKIASNNDPIEHITDLFDPIKVADHDKDIPAEAVVGVLNKGMANILPALEASEPDLPTALLDRIALSHSLPDILTTFIHNMIPLKPREYTRIVIVHHGLPMSMFGNIMKSIDTAPESTVDPLDGGKYEPQITNAISKFIPERTSAVPFIFDRILKVAAEGVRVDPIGQAAAAAAYGLGGNSQWGAYQYPVYPLPGDRAKSHSAHYAAPLEPSYYSTIPTSNLRYNVKPALIAGSHGARDTSLFAKYEHDPVLYQAAEYQRRKDRQVPLNVVSVALVLGAMYAAYRGLNSVTKIHNAVGSKGVAAGVGLTGVMLVNALRQNTPLEKRAMHKGWYAAPFVGTHLMAAHSRKREMEGRQINPVERFLIDNADVISVASPFAMHILRRKIAAEHRDPSIEVFLQKTADVMDTLATAAIGGIIFRPRGASMLTGVTDMTGDALAIQTAQKLFEAEKDPRKKIVHDDIPIN